MKEEAFAKTCSRDDKKQLKQIMGRNTGREAKALPQLKGGKYMGKSMLKMESVDAPPFLRLSLDTRPFVDMYPPLKAEDRPLFPPTNDVFITDKSLTPEQKDAARRMVLKRRRVLLFNPLIHTADFKPVVDARKFGRIKEELNINSACRRDNFAMYDFNPDCTEYSLRKYQDIKDSHAKSLKKSSSCFRLKRQELADSLKDNSSKEFGKDIHPLFAPHDLIKRPQTTSLLVRSQSESNVSRAKYSNSDSSSAKSQSPTTSDKKVPNKGSPRPNTATVINSSNTLPCSCNKRATPKQWVGFTGLGSGVDFRHALANLKGVEKEQQKLGKAIYEAQTALSDLDAFDKHLSASVGKRILSF